MEMEEIKRLKEEERVYLDEKEKKVFRDILIKSDYGRHWKIIHETKG
jgi:hypothetical protein